MSTRSTRTRVTGMKSSAPAKAAVDEELGSGVDVQYNPEIIEGALHDLEMRMNSKCQQIQKDADFMCTSIRQAFHLELIKLPTHVKQMSLNRFKNEFGDSVEAVARGAIHGNNKTSSSSARENSRSSSNLYRASGSTSDSTMRKSSNSRASGSTSGSSKIHAAFQTPSGSKGNGAGSRIGATPSTVARKAKEGEIIMSAMVLHLVNMILL